MIRLCSYKEAIRILNEPETIERLGIVTEDLKVQPWIAEQGEHKMMFVFWLVRDSVYEVHIASPKKSVIKSRGLAREVIEFAFNAGARKVITNCPEGKIANMARKLGMVEFKREQDKIWFEVNYGCWSSNSR